MTFKDSLYTVTTCLITRIVLPDWIMPLTEKTRKIDLGFKELRVGVCVFVMAELSEIH